MPRTLKTHYKTTEAHRHSVAEYNAKNKEKKSQYMRKRRQDPLKRAQDKQRISERKEKYPIECKKIAYVAGAKTRGYEWNLTDGQFRDLYTGDCYYCGEENANGIDRVDNQLGYSPENCESCCKFCNRAKMDESMETFIMKCQQVAKRFARIIDTRDQTSTGSCKEVA